MTVARVCDSPQAGMKTIRKVYQLMERCDDPLGGGGGCKGSW